MVEKSQSSDSRWRFLFLPLLVAVVTAGLAYRWPDTLKEMPLFKSARSSQPMSVENPLSETCSCTVPKLVGMVDDCCCDYHTADTLNKEVLFPLLQEIVTKPFFKYFKVRLWCDCPFWPDDGMCHLRDCSVCECADDDIPEPFRMPSGGSKVLKPSDDPTCQEGNPNAAVNRTLDHAFRGWAEVDNPWTHDNESLNEEMTYVNLQLNPERYTGYKGSSARRVWEAIYAENCFKDGSEDTCEERRVFYRLISGLHTSITVHIAANYLVDEATSMWGPNVDIYKYRVAKFPQRLQNLYFTYLFVLRAITKASDFLAEATYETGNPVEDTETQELMRMLVNSSRLKSACPVPFDEARLWKGEDGPQLRQQLTQHFRNISAILDCTGCEKCRLWGKLQILGLGTALKILFSVEDQKQLELQRNEVIALMNLLNRLSESLQSAAELSALLDETTLEPLPQARGINREGSGNLLGSPSKFSAILPS